MTDEKKGGTQAKADEPKTTQAAKRVTIENVMTAGKLFTSEGVIGPGQTIELPVDEARHFCEPQIDVAHYPKGHELYGQTREIKRSGKARIPFPE